MCPAQLSRAAEAELREEVVSLTQEKRELQYNICLLEEDSQMLREEIQHLRGKTLGPERHGLFPWISKGSMWSNCCFLFSRWQQWEQGLHPAGAPGVRGGRATADGEEGLSGGGAAPSHSGETPTQRERGRVEIYHSTPQHVHIFMFNCYSNMFHKLIYTWIHTR